MKIKMLTTRSRITVRWTTAPGDMGYGGSQTNWLGERGETMSLRQAASFAESLNQRIGHGTYRLIDYRNGGNTVLLVDIHAVLADAQYR